jgi:multidrug efflux pump subunit AcrA (membrane-fusion protein)
VGVIAALYAAGTLPRLRREAVLAHDAQQVRSAVPAVQLVSPRWVPQGSTTLPGTIQAIRQTSIGARATGYVRRLYVDIGSHVRAGQLVAELEAPELDQQVYQANAQTAQSRATVSQSQATVAQQQATVFANQATVVQNQSTVQQAYALVESSRAKVVQAQAAEKQAEANLAETKHALAEARATLTQMQAQLQLARANYLRTRQLVAQGYLAQQDADISLTAVRTAQANVGVAEAAVNAAQANVDAAAQAVSASQAAVKSAQADLTASEKSAKAAEGALGAAQSTVQATQQSVRASREAVRGNQALVDANQANADRFAVMQGYVKVLAPFDGTITSRNVDIGSLVTADTATGSAAGAASWTASTAPQSGLFGIAQTDAVRIDVSVPQTFASLVRPGSKAQVTVRELPGRDFTGTVSLRAGALDAQSRTQLVEVDLPNRDGALTPGMYADVQLSPANAPRTLQIPGTALIFDAHGTQVASVTPQGRVHFLPVQEGADYGSEVEIRTGLRGNEKLVNNPPDTLTEGARVAVGSRQSAGSM